MRAPARRPAAQLVETALAGVGGALLGGLVLRPIHLGTVGAAVGGANGALGGYRGVYEWSETRGWVAAALDSTWGLVGTAAGLAIHALGAARGNAGYVDDLSRRCNRYVYERGWTPRPHFAFTAGNVITGARDGTDPRRRELIERHENLHVWQGRWFGPLYPVLYGAWMAGGAVAGTVAWARGRNPSWFAAVERRAYYFNPFERWAYLADDNWPPPRLLRLGE